LGWFSFRCTHTPWCKPTHPVKTNANENQPHKPLAHQQKWFARPKGTALRTNARAANEPLHRESEPRTALSAFGDRRQDLRTIGPQTSPEGSRWPRGEKGFSLPAEAGHGPSFRCIRCTDTPAAPKISRGVGGLQTTKSPSPHGGSHDGRGETGGRGASKGKQSAPRAPRWRGQQSGVRSDARARLQRGLEGATERRPATRPRPLPLQIAKLEPIFITLGAAPRHEGLQRIRPGCIALQRIATL
jgi:hypothetical protein